MDLTPEKKKRISASVPKELQRRLDELKYKAKMVHHVKMSRSEIITYLCSEQLDANDSDEIINRIVEERKEEEKVTATTWRRRISFWCLERIKEMFLLAYKTCGLAVTLPHV